MIHLSKIKTILFSLILFLVYTSIHAQTGEIRGKVTDKSNGEGWIGVLVSVIDSAGHSNPRVMTDVYGNYIISKIAPAKYNLLFSIKGFKSITIEGVIVSASKATFLNVQLESSEKPYKAF